MFHCSREHISKRRRIHNNTPVDTPPSKRRLASVCVEMLIQVVPYNMMAQQPRFLPGEILINGTCVRVPPLLNSPALLCILLVSPHPADPARACACRTRCPAGTP